MPAIPSVANTMLNDADQVELNANAKTNYENGTVRKLTSVAKTDTATLTPANILGGLILGTPTSAATYTLPTAADLVAAIDECAVGDCFVFSVVNLGADTDKITIAADASGTDDGVLTVAQNNCRQFLVHITNVTASSEAYKVYGLGPAD